MISPPLRVVLYILERAVIINIYIGGKDSK